MARVSRALLLIVAGLLLVACAQAAAASAPTREAPAASAAGGVHAAAARKKRKRPGCGKFCRQAGGFGAGPDQKNAVVVASRRLRPDSDGVVAVRARCVLDRNCVGAILLVGKIEYGRSDLRIPARTTRVVYVALSNAGRAYLRRHGADRSVYATVPLVSNDPVSFSSRLTLLPAR
jgi:hypothetical protein